MAGSYNHMVNHEGDGKLYSSRNMLIDNLGDAWEMAEEMYGMIWYLASRWDAEHDSEFGVADRTPAMVAEDVARRVEEARENYLRGLDASPGVQK